jgi:DNA helicase II / ATP-dependent DNA helicase PcrA
MSFFDTHEVQSVVNYLKFVQTGEFQYFEQSINVPVRRVDSGIISFVKNNPNVQILKIIRNEPFDKENKMGIMEYLLIVDKITKMNNLGEPVEKIVKYLIDNLLFFIKRNNPKILNQKWENLNELHETAMRIKNDSTKKPIEQFIDHIDSLLDHSSSRNTNESVRISTLHRSKGLEWPVVFIPCLETGVLPSFKASSKSELDEER